ncbi:MAG: hypothetical protein V3S27_10560 [Kiloniellales bacterium]
MLDPGQFRRLVVRPALQAIGLCSPAAERLLLGTALTESGLTWLAQKGGGPALGIFQIEPATHADVWTNYLAYRENLASRVASLASEQPRLGQLVWNLAYATAIARLIYYRRPEPLPAAADLAGLARYWKAHFNSALGAGSAEDFLTRAGPVLENL